MADAAPDSKKHLMMTAIVILLLTLMGAGVGFAVGVFLKPAEMPSTADAPAAGAGGEKPSAAADARSAAAPASPEGAADAKTAHGGNSDAEAENVALLTDAEQPPPGDLAVVPLSPVLTTLGSPKNTWIRLEGSILIKPGSGIPNEQLSGQAGEQILGYLRTADLSQIDGPSGFLALRNDLNETLRTLSEGYVQGLLIHGLVVE